jgi:hypothetical protein
VQLVQLAHAQVNGITVASTVADVRHKVLRCRDDAFALERANEHVSKQRGEEGIFAVGLLDASPAHIGGDVHDR